MKPGPGGKPAGVGGLPPGAGAGPSGPGSESARPGSEPALRSSELVRPGPATGLVLPGGRSTLPGAEPVFVLSAGWSGSTLLRSLLDAHPELACPPEIRLATMCAQIASVWSQLEGAPLPTERTDAPPAVPAAALAGIRHTMNEMITPYLERRGKWRYCDKSLGAAEHADVLRAVFPEAAGEAIFRFLGVPPVAGLAEACFTGGRAEPSDYRIWHASRINPRSAGGGWPIPAAMIGSSMTATINALADKLGYARIDAQRETTAAADPRRPGGRPVAAERPASGSGQAPQRAAGGSGQAPPGLRLVVAHLLSGLAGLDDPFTQRWEPCSLETFLVTVISGAGDVVARWRVDLKTRTVTSADGLPPGEAAGAVWEVVGPIDPWMQVVEGEMSLSVALRRRLLRYCDTGDPTPTMLNRIAMLADLLGITTWQRAQPLRPTGERRQDRGPRRPGPGQAEPAGNVPRPVHPGGAAHPSGPGHANGAVHPADQRGPAAVPAPAAAARSPAALPMGLMAYPGATITRLTWPAPGAR